MPRFVFILVCLAATVAEAAYLPVAGPSVLRFKFAYAGELASLPPLIKVELEPVLTVMTNVVTVTNVVNVVAMVTNAPGQTNEIPVITNLTSSATNKVASVGPEIKPESPLPPQVLMQFFRDRVNTNANTTVVGTVGFTPPPPMAPPSSKATFEKR